IRRDSTLAHVSFPAIRPRVHLRIPQRHGGARFLVPIFIVRRRKADHFPLPGGGVLDEALHLRILAATGPLMITLEGVIRRTPDEMMAEARPEIRRHVAGAMPGAHGEYQQIARLREHGFLVLVQLGVLLPRPMRRPEREVARLLL